MSGMAATGTARWSILDWPPMAPKYVLPMSKKVVATPGPLSMQHFLNAVPFVFSLCGRTPPRHTVRVRCMVPSSSLCTP
eukprot:7500103-Pyramimonas_sp.AAC.1